MSSKSSKIPCKFPAIPRLSDDPKLVAVDDAEVVGDSIAEAVPVLGNCVFQEFQNCSLELPERFVVPVVGRVLVHESPTLFDRIDMDSLLCGMCCFYRLEQGNQAHCVDLCHLQHLCLAGLKVDGTMNVQALAPGRLFHRDRSILRRPTSRGPYLMRGMDGIDEHHSLVRSHGVEKLLVACDEGLLPDIIEAAWHLVRLR